MGLYDVLLTFAFGLVHVLFLVVQVVVLVNAVLVDDVFVLSLLKSLEGAFFDLLKQLLWVLLLESQMDLPVISCFVETHAFVV